MKFFDYWLLFRWCYHGKILIAEFTEQEATLFQQAVEWLSCNLNSAPTLVKQQTTGFVIDPFTRTFNNENGNIVYLTAKEFDLLYFLYCHKGQVFSKEQLYESVWGYDSAIEGNNLTSFIRKLRKKIEPDPDNPQYILTVWGVGYKFSKEKP